jgi:predicted O-methyltransferase YrrM
MNMSKIKEQIKEKIIEVTNLGLTDKADYHTYEDVYPSLLEKFIGKKNDILEIGIGGGGGGLKILSDLFPESNIYGIDYNLSICTLFDLSTLPNVELFEFDQCDSKMLDNLPMLDFVIEDASHDMVKSIQTFELLESKLNPGAVYVIEDVYFNFYDSYIKDGRFEMIDLRNVKGRGDDILAVYYKR